MKAKIFNVCDTCGLEANRLTCLKKYGKEPLKAKFEVSTYHRGFCDVCGKEGAVTEPRDFFYPDFSLLPIRKVIHDGDHGMTDMGIDWENVRVKE